MRYRKIKADKIFDGYRFIENGVLLVDKQGEIENLTTENNAGDEVEAYKGILSPGFINCHCHLELSHMRGKIPEKTGLVDFVFKVVTERSASEEEILKAINLGEKEMIENGIVAVGDICNHTSTIAQKQKANLAYYNFIEASGWLPEVSNARFERAKLIFDAYEEFDYLKRSAEHKAPCQNVILKSHCAIVPHAPYSVSENLWQAIQPFFKNKTVSIHNQETKFEDEFFEKGTGDFVRMYAMMNLDNNHHQPTSKSSLQNYFLKLSEADKILLVHNTFTKQADIDFIKQKNIENTELSLNKLKTQNHIPETFFCLCPNANVYIEDTLPPVDLLRKNNCSIVLGTDSLASNWSLNILDEIKTLITRQRNTQAKIEDQLTLEEMLGWATMNGAKALGMDETLGSFEKGKRPGGVLFSEDSLRVIEKLF